MREQKLLCDADTQESGSSGRSRRTYLLVGLALAFIVIGSIAAFFIVPSRTEPTPNLPEASSNKYLNHYSVDQASVAYEKYQVTFDLVLDAKPDFGNDNIKPTDLNPELPRLRAIIATESDHRLHVKLVDAEKSRWELPIHTEEISQDPQDHLLSFQRFDIKKSGLTLSKERFGWSLLDRDSSDSAIVTTEGAYFRYLDKYMVTEVLVDTDRVFGLGERLANVSLREGNYTVYSRDQGTVIETKKNPGNNLYGSHPFVMYQLRNGQFAGIFYRTSEALQVELRYSTDYHKTALRFSTIGGIMDFYVFYKGDAQFVLQQYHTLVGRPVLPPWWSLGYHYGRGGVTSLKDLEEIVRNFTAQGIPLDSIWLDSAILDTGKNFKVNDKAFPGLKQFVQDVKNKHHIRFVPVLEPGIKAEAGYEYYEKMDKEDLLVKTANDKTFVGKTHVGPVGFPNFWNLKTQELWQAGVKAFIEGTGMDGFWLNLNEFSQLCDGECHSSSTSSSLPFIPGDTPLETRALPLDATYHIGDKSKDPFLTELNVHSVNSFLMSQSTAGAFDKIAETSNKRIFLASRSTFPGIQKYATSHWMGETPGVWDQLKYSIPAVMSFSMFGLPLVGSGICGYDSNATEELCARWTQLGLLYPLSLNLNKDLHSNSLPRFSAKTTELTIHAIQTKYSLLRHIYTQLFEQSLYGGAAVRPLFFEFPNDPMSFRVSDRVFMYGSGVMVTTALEADQKGYSVYFPNSNWYKLPGGNEMLKHNDNKAEGTVLQVDVESDRPNVFVRGGTILPYQDAVGLKVKNVEELNEMPMNLIIALDEKNEAAGRMVVDDGISKDTLAAHKYRHYSYTFAHKTLKVTLLDGYNYTTNTSTGAYPFENFNSLQIWGATGFKNISSACAITNVMSRRGLKTEYNEEKNVLTVYDISKRKLSLRAIETIAVFADDDYNFCLGGFVASKIKISDQLRRMTALLETGFDMSDRKYRMDAILMNDHVLNLKIGPTNWKAWEVPGIVDEGKRNTTGGKMAFAEYMFAISTDPDPFFFAVANPNDPEDTTITTQDMPLVLDEHFVEVSTLVKATAIYGLGERVFPHFELPNGIYTLYSRSAVSPVEDGEAPGKNMYSSHPFYMFKMPDGTFGGVFMLNSNAMDVTILPFDEGVYKVDHISSGGLIDMFVIQRGPPKMILEEYHNIIGKPHVLPYWAFGNHQSRYGYRTQQKLKEVVEKYSKARIPLEALWVDIDYMDSYRPFTVDKERFPSMPDFVNWLHEQNIKLIPIVEASVPVDDSNKAYKAGLDMDVFIQRGEADGTIAKYKHVLGIVWPGYSTFVDFVHPNSTNYWTSMLEYMSTSLFPFDGIWLDMNEVTQFCDGECNLNGDNRKPSDIANARFKDLPYIPGHRNLQQKGLPLDAQHYSPSPADRPNYVEYNMHSLYGHYEMKATNEFFKKHKQRPFIISRSTFPGSGRYGSHWLGDNKSEWAFLAYSIIGIYNFQMFGIPFTGPDVCGYSGNATIELCRRWYQLAAFYPFCRNHNHHNATDQEPYVDDSLAGTAEIALQLRYSLIRYMYSLHMMTSIKGGAYFMPLFYEFTSDPEAYKNTERTFMLGSALKVSPVLEAGATKVTTYFPNSHWFALDSGKKVLEYSAKEKTGKNLTLDAGFATNAINVHLRGGQIIPWQDTAKHPVMTTKDLKEMETAFIIAPDHTEKAEGEVYFDDETVADPIKEGAYKIFHVSYQKGKMMFSADASIKNEKEGAERNKDETLGEVRLYNAKGYQNVKYACANLHTEAKVKLDAVYDGPNEVLKMKPEKTVVIGDIRSIVWDDEHITC